ncbi:winged helix-turn-helix domain-containing protein [Frankia sp. CpI1-P]|uniref:winged helix-turn-helix domain-containing protein n=1 Tax=Frankia sp. CpI1-P TaxID=1502734 RepID=UPI001F5BCE62|nr:crosslink repair DNA glycosylase YcaQ family protein [Frankia sp. CpI1-P]
MLARAHYLPGWSRLGPYSREMFDRLVQVERYAYEYWAHEASLVPVAWEPLFRWRAAAALAGEGLWRGVAAFGRERADYVADALAQVRDRGPLAAADLAEPGRGGGGWWGWADGKRALEYLMWTGQLCVAGRRASFERLYDLPERVIPPAVLGLPTPDPHEAVRILLGHAADRLGVATAGDLADYFRLPAAVARPRLAEVVENGELVEVGVAGWSGRAYARPELTVARRAAARALLSPFDPLVWERARTRRLFGMDLVLELYTPAPKRRYGYYVLPFLLGDRLAARVDLKADRAARVLRVAAAWHEPDPGSDIPAPRRSVRPGRAGQPSVVAAGRDLAGRDLAGRDLAGRDLGGSDPAGSASDGPDPGSPATVAGELAAELAALAGWLGLDRIEVVANGTLAPALTRAVAALGAAG